MSYYWEILLIVVFISIISKKLSHTGDFFSLAGWDVEDFFCAYEITFLTVILRFLDVYKSFSLLRFPSFVFKLSYVKQILEIDIVAKISLLVFMIAMTILEKYVGRNIYRKNKLGKLFLLVIHNFLSFFLYTLFVINPSFTGDYVGVATTLTLLMVYFIFLALLEEKVEIRKNKTLTDTVDEINKDINKGKSA